ncbi:DUF2851 family protein [Chloroflexota bacterium]
MGEIRDVAYSLVEKAKVAESQVVRIWQHQLMDRSKLTTEGGELIRVIYPGRINEGRGADFRDAVVVIGRQVMRGDIEVHVKSGAWRNHRHHHDPAYNRVILHVVMWQDNGEVTELQNGKSVPVLALGKYMESSPNQNLEQVYSTASLSVPCLGVAARVSRGVIAEYLDAAGKERFSAKVGRFQSELAQTGASQCLYHGMMGALGYSKNKLPCLELAYRVPLQVLESMTKGEVVDEECLSQQQALLLVTAGLLPSQGRNGHGRDKADSSWVAELERLWVSYQQAETMSRDSWQFFRVRPNNFPVRRIVAMTYLILRYREGGILEGIVNLVKETPSSRGHIRLEQGLLVTTDDYWAHHFDFGPVSRMRIPNLLGSRRAADIIVNVLLPFVAAWSRINSHPELANKAFALYCGYPGLTANSVGTHMRVHPILHWRELDVWEYIRSEGIPSNPMYFAKNGKRYRSLGCKPCTSPIASNATKIDEIVEELKTTKIVERSGRAQDKERAFTMQKLRALGYM